MYIWTAIDVSDQLTDLKSKVIDIENKIDFIESDLSLPLHVSLIISKEIRDSDLNNIIDDITSIFKNVVPFKIDTFRFELHETISWLKMKENDNLQNLHLTIANLFKDKYNIPYHDFDKNFIYHTTLFLDSDISKVKDAFMMIKDFEFPSTLKVNKFIIGVSSNGDIGTYKVIKEINI